MADNQILKLLLQYLELKKTNLPGNHKVPKGFKTFLGSVKSELMDPKSRNKASRNIQDDEMEALLELINIQREGKIVIKPCDKGAGIIILNHSDYSKACMDPLNSERRNENGTSSKFYIEGIVA